MSHPHPLNVCHLGTRGLIVQVGTRAGDEHAQELERRLLELGFVEGARFEVRHEGFLGRDPMAVQVNDACIALRRREAANILVRIEAAVWYAICAWRWLARPIVARRPCSTP